MNNYFDIFNNKISIPISELPDVPEASWKSPSNIALIKYWGKKKGQKPANASLSMTLHKAVTYTWVKAYPAGRSKAGIVSINEQTVHAFLPRLQDLYDLLASEIPSIRDLSLEVRTENSFPHSTGIASSASGISAFTFCLLSLAGALSGSVMHQEKFFRAASFASRLGSGSASRSAYGGFTIWGKTPSVKNTSDLEAIPVNELVDASYLQLRDTILLVSSEPKALGSSQGHRLMDVHPFAAGRYTQAGENLHNLLHAMHKGSFNEVAGIVENEALSLHALLMTSGEDGLLMQPPTLEIIRKIRKARKDGLPVCFTMDAGPNVHMLHTNNYSEQVEDFVRHDLLMLCEGGKAIFDRCGEGPVPIHTSLL